MPMHDEETFAKYPGSDAEMFIQWKGTDVCIDFRCKCGASYHYDGDFMYAVHCQACGRFYKMGTQVLAREIPREDVSGILVDFSADTEIDGVAIVQHAELLDISEVK
jgi:hypothetical protein